jgi:2-methylcitrate dehydratase PrpD
MSENVTGLLAGFAASLQYENLPGPVRDHCKNVLLDTLACAVAGHRGEETQQLAALASGLAPSSESSVIGGDRLSLAGATLLNGYLVTAVTMCDIHRSTLTHVTPEVIPAALAIAERDGASGRDLMVALAAGFEVTTRVGLGVDYPAFRAKGWHGPGVLGPFGAAAAVGRLRGFDTDTMAKAFGLAGSQAAGTFAAWGTPTVKFHQCRGALSGLMAGLLAEQDFLATREFLTAKDGGLFNTYANGGRPEAVTAGLGKRWELEQIALRLWPSASSIQGMNTAMFDLIEQHKIDPARVKKVRVALSQPVFDLHGKLAKYKAKFDALISGHYTAAVILHDQELTLDQFEPARYDDPKLRHAAAEQVELRPDAALRGVQAVVDIEIDGKTLTARCENPRGSAENPLSRAQLESKFRTYADGVLAPSAVAETIEAVGNLENLGSVRKLMDMLRAAPRRGQAERATPAAARGCPGRQTGPQARRRRSRRHCVRSDRADAREGTRLRPRVDQTHGRRLGPARDHGRDRICRGAAAAWRQKGFDRRTVEQDHGQADGRVHGDEWIQGRA